jgi:hypothetical protein
MPQLDGLPKARYFPKSTGRRVQCFVPILIVIVSLMGLSTGYGAAPAATNPASCRTTNSRSAAADVAGTGIGCLSIRNPRVACTVLPRVNLVQPALTRTSSIRSLNEIISWCEYATILKGWPGKSLSRCTKVADNSSDSVIGAPVFF